jgi:4-amino-4-deoxy-L-arabinose transferase-like glycosyltransferase
MRTLRRPDKAESLAFLAVILTGASIALYGVSSLNVWVDEGSTWFFINLSWWEMLDTLRFVGVHPPLYFILLKAITDLSGSGELALRSISIAAYLAAVYLAYRVGGRVAGSAGAVIGAIFLALHPMQLWYARDARPYALAGALAGALLLLFMRIRSGEGGRYAWFGALIAAMLGLLTHYFFFLFMGALILISILGMREQRGFFRGWTLMSLLAMIPIGIWMIWYFQLEAPSLGIGWIQPPLFVDLLLTIWNLLSGFGGRVTFLNLATGVIFLLLALLGSRRDSDYGLTGLLLPVAGVWLLSQRRPIYIDRYFIVLMPILALLVAKGGSVLMEISWAKDQRRRGIQALLLVLVSGSAVVSGWQIHTAPWYAKEDWKGLIRTLETSPYVDLPIWLSDSELLLPLSYYRVEDLARASYAEEPACAQECWWILRQPYTAVHAFAQAVKESGREWPPVPPDGCRIAYRWDSPTGIALWRLSCAIELNSIPDSAE